MKTHAVKKRQKVTTEDGGNINKLITTGFGDGHDAVHRILRTSQVQAKLEVGQPGDVYEQEADRVSEQIMTMPDSEMAVAEETPPLVQKKSETYGTDSDSVVSSSMESRLSTLKQSGVPMPKNDRQFFEHRFGADFENVRVHTGGQAHEMNKSLNAKAFTTGNNIFFRQGAYKPENADGRKLLAHELTHVLQQKTPDQTNDSIRKFRSTSEKIQCSPLSETFARHWITGPDTFFCELEALEASDNDLVTFVETTLDGYDLLRALQIMGIERVLSIDYRNALLARLVSRLGSAEVDFSNACTQFREDLSNEEKAKADLAKLVIGVVAAFVVPGLGGAISALANQIPIQASETVYRVAMGIQSQAASIAGAIGEVGKTMAGRSIDSAYASNPRAFCNALTEGFQQLKDGIVSEVAGNIENREALSDEELIVYIANWDPGGITVERYKTEIRTLWTRYEQQVLAIGAVDGDIMGGELTASRTTRLCRIRSGGRTRLALINVVTRMTIFNTISYEFVRWVDSDMEPMALQAGARQRDIQTFDASQIENVR